MEKISFWKIKNKGSDKKANSDISRCFDKTKINISHVPKKNVNSHQKANEENCSISSHSFTARQEKLTKYCQHLDSKIQEAQCILNEAYKDAKEDNLQDRLKRNVNELICLQKEMKNIVDNTKALKIQINAVRANVKDQKAKIKSFRNEENRTRFSLISEKSNQSYKNSIKFGRDTVPKTRAQPSSTSPIGETSSISTEFKNSTRQSNIPKPINVGTSSNIPRPHIRKHLVSNDRAFFVPPTNKNTKTSRQSFNRGISDGRKTGITVYLHPINEADSLENEEDNTPPLSQSHPVTPNPSIINFPWLNVSTPSDTTTHPESLPSDTYSLSNEE